MAKPDVFRMLGCVAMVTLIFVIAVKLSKQCMAHPPPSPSSVSRPSVEAEESECMAGFTLDKNGFCIRNL
jgi:hypothetical protein